MPAAAVRKIQGSNRYADVQARYEAFKSALRVHGGNATQAAIDAGYSPKSASVIGSQLLKRLKVQEGAEGRSHALLEKSLLSEESLVKELDRIVKFDPRKLFTKDGRLKAPSEWSDDVAAAISSIDQSEITAGETVIGQTSKLRWWDKLGAIEKAMRYRGMFERDNRQRAEAISLEVSFSSPEPRPGDYAKVIEGAVPEITTTKKRK